MTALRARSGPMRAACPSARLAPGLLAVLLALVLALPRPGLSATAGGMAGTLLDEMTKSPAARKDEAAARPTARTGPVAPTPPSPPVVPGAPAASPGQNDSQPRQPRTAPEQKPQKFQKSQTSQPREVTLTQDHDGALRRALLRLPRSAPQKKGQAAPKLPLLIFLHGAGGSAAQAMRQTRLADMAERAGFLSVFPEGLGPEGGQTWNAWMCCGYARDQHVDDVGYLAALISRLRAEYPVDPRRIYLAGFSNGAMLASRFALERPGVAAAIAVVAGYLPCDADTSPEPLAVLIIHGNHDCVARFGPTEAHPRTGRYCEDYPAKAQVDFWVRGLGLSTKPQVQDGKKSRVRVEDYGPGKGGRSLVRFVIVKAGGHAWPGGARERYRYCDPPTDGPDVSALVLDFFKRQARSGPSEKTDKAERQTAKPVHAPAPAKKKARPTP